MHHRLPFPAFRVVVALLLVMLTRCALVPPPVDLDDPLWKKGLPAEWSDEPVIVLEDSSRVDFVPGKQRNSVAHRNVRLIRVVERNPPVYESIVVSHFETFEQRPFIAVTAWYPDGSVWRSSPASVGTVRYAEQDEYSTNRLVQTVRLPRYVKGMLIREEVVGDYFRPEFVWTEPLRRATRSGSATTPTLAEASSTWVTVGSFSTCPRCMAAIHGSRHSSTKGRGVSLGTARRTPGGQSPRPRRAILRISAATR